jgi:hypothetical protein
VINKLFTIPIILIWPQEKLELDMVAHAYNCSYSVRQTQEYGRSHAQKGSEILSQKLNKQKGWKGSISIRLLT